MAHFFATPEDLFPVLLGVESRRAVSYTLAGNINAPTVSSFCSVSDIPSMLKPAPTDSAITGPSYLITDAEHAVVLREIVQYTGRKKWVVDQLQNPDSTVLRHGGLFAGNILLSGEVRTASKSKISASLQRAFENEIKANFVRIKSFYVGKQAEEMLDSGCRLTQSSRSPAEYDLRRD